MLAVIQEKNRKGKVALKMSTKYYNIYVQCQASVLNTVQGYQSYETLRAVTLEMCTHKINVCCFTKVAGQI